MTLILGVLRLVALLIVATMMVAYTIVLLPFLPLAVAIERAWKWLTSSERDTETSHKPGPY